MLSYILNMGNTISSAFSSLENEKKEYLEKYLDINLKLNNEEVSDEKKEKYEKKIKKILNILFNINNELSFVKYLYDNQDKLFEKYDDNFQIICIDRSYNYFHKILSYLENFINSYPDDVKSSSYYNLVNNGDFITLQDDQNDRAFNTLFLEKRNSAIKAYFPEYAWGDDEFKCSGESNLPRQFLNESKEYPIEKWDIGFHGSWANLSVKFMKKVLVSNPEYFSNIKVIFDKYNSDYLIRDINNIISEYLFSDYTLNITMLKLEWGIFLFNKSKKDLFKYINDPDHADYIIGFGDQWMNCIHDVWMDYIKETKQQFAVSLAWDE